MNRKFSPKKRLSIAYHEAGHAVAYHDVGLEFIEVGVLDRAEEYTGLSGFVTGDGNQGCTRPQQLIVCLAGAIAQATYLNRNKKVGSMIKVGSVIQAASFSDFEKAIQAAENITKDTVAYFVNYTKYASYASTITKRTFLDMGHEEAANLIFRRWGDIKLVAQALFERGTLSYKEFKEIILVRRPKGKLIIERRIDFEISKLIDDLHERHEADEILELEAEG